jgi:hypothetical protein
VCLRTDVLGPLALLVLTAAGCTNGTGTDLPGSPTPTPPGDEGVVELVYEFDDGADGWTADVADFSVDTRPEDVVVETGVAPPGSAGAPAGGFLHLAATNRSDDLFTYLRREVDEGLQPATEYEVSFVVTFASDAPSGCVGVGGAPGESVWLKVGASSQEPTPVEVDGETRLSVDKGNQAQGGEAAVVAGVVANGIPCEEALASPSPPYALVTLTATLDRAATTDAGALWVFVGTDSGFESRTSIYYDRIEIGLRSVGAGASQG